MDDEEYELIDITPLGASEPVYVRGFSRTDRAIAEAKAHYVAGAMTAEEFEQAVEIAYLERAYRANRNS